MDRNKATAPYNFVSLPKQVIAAPLEKNIQAEQWDKDDSAYIESARADFRKYIEKNIEDQDALSGEIELDITTETPCFVGGYMDPDAADDAAQEFFSPTGKPILPGSSLRGMVKNMYKIITCGAMRKEEDFHDQHLYFRSIAAPKSIRDYKQHYLDRMTGVAAGFLVGRGREYFICPGYAEDPRPDGRRTNESFEIEWQQGKCACYTGPMGKKHHYDIIEYPQDWSVTLPISEEVIKSYREDKKRGNANGDPKKAADWDLFELAEKKSAAKEITDNHYDMVVPCFYKEENGIVQHFGFGPSYRIPYQKSIAQHIPEALQSRKVDFADAVFGRKELWGGRVFFDDAVWQGSGNPYLQAGKTPPLMSPNPTSFQLYLRTDGYGQPQHWDRNTDIRGYKLYWHKNCGANWRTDTTDDDTHPIIPVRAGSHFKGKIRFERLTAVELGSVLRVFELAREDEDLRYKIGKGKSLGMGTIKIETKLSVLDADEAYSHLFDANGLADCLRPDDGTLWQKSITAFDAYRQRECCEMGYEAGYEILQGELRHMLDWKNEEKKPGWQQLTSHMELGGTEFRNRLALPTVGELFPSGSQR